MAQNKSTIMMIVLVIAILANGCMCPRFKLAEFEQLELDAKTAYYESAAQDDCFRHDRNVYLGLISEHGVAAVDAMSQFLHADDPLMRLDAIRVARFVHARGIDLSRHPIVTDINRIASDPSDEVWKEARDALRLLLKDHPTDLE